MEFAIFGPHIVAGALALGLYWRTLLARKGSEAHRRRGRAYLVVLPPLLASVVPISLHLGGQSGPDRADRLSRACARDRRLDRVARGSRPRRSPERFRGRVFRALAVAMAACGTGLMVMGIMKNDVLAVGFAVIGIVYGGAMLGELGRPPAPDWWLSWHLNGVSLLFAATHASFIGLLARHLMPDYAGHAMHALTQLGTIAFAYFLRQWLGRRYAYLADGDRAGWLGARRSPPCGAPFIVTLAGAILRIAPVDLRWRLPLVQKAGIYFSGTPSKSGYAGYAHPGVFIRQYCSR